jgi:hypothetical protein
MPGKMVKKETEPEMLARLNKKLQEKGLPQAARDIIVQQIKNITEASQREAARVKAVEEARAAEAAAQAAALAAENERRVMKAMQSVPQQVVQEAAQPVTESKEARRQRQAAATAAIELRNTQLQAAVKWAKKQQNLWHLITCQGDTENGNELIRLHEAAGGY